MIIRELHPERVNDLGPDVRVKVNDLPGFEVIVINRFMSFEYLQMFATGVG